MDLVVTSLEPWDAVWRRNQHLVAGLLRRDPSLRVLFVEPSPDPLHAVLSGSRPRRGRGLRAGSELSGIPAGRLWLHEPTKWMPRRIDRAVDERWARSVLRAAARLSMDDPVLWVNDPTGARLVQRTGWRSLYDITDDWTLAERTPDETRRVTDDERLLLERVDEVVVCSRTLAATKRTERRVTLVPNGVDTAAYRVRRPRPDDLPAGRVAVYVGTLHPDRLDVALCETTARALGDTGRVVLVGPDALPPGERARLDAAGVVRLGARPSDDVPGYLQHADVLLVPHVVTGFTDSLDPIKLYEYAAAARPVVATPVAGFRDSDDEQVTVVGAADFPAVVLARLTAPPAAPMDPVGGLAELDWGRRVEQMAAVVERVRAARP